VEQSRQSSALLLSEASDTPPDFTFTVGRLTINGHISRSLVTDNYFAVDATRPGLLSLVVNIRHPHLAGVKPEGLVEHLEHCTYEALGEWQALHRLSSTDIGVVRAFQNVLLRAGASSEPISSNGAGS
jgi:hypothetical protein